MSTPDLTAPESAPVATRSPHTVSRRSVLGGLGLGSLAALVAPMFGLAPTAAAEPTRTKSRPRQLADNGPYTPATPYLTEASCELTEDYFLTDEVLIDLGGGDQIMPFTTTTGQVEAVVLSGPAASRQVSHLAHDPSTISGWSYTTISTALTRVASAAVYGTSGKQPQLLVSGQNGEASQMVVLQYGDNGWAPVGSPIGVPPTLDAIRSGTGPNGQFFYGWAAAASGSTVTLSVLLFDSSHTAGTLVSSQRYQGTEIDDVVMRYDPQGKDGWIVVTIGDQVSTSAQTSPVTFASPKSRTLAKLDTLLGAYGSGPDILWQDTSGQINITNNEMSAALGGTSGTAAASVATWVTGDAYTFAFCLDETIVVISDETLAASGSSGAAVPLLPGITRVFGVDTDPAQSVLFAVDLDASLSVLSHGPTGWTQNVVHQSSASFQEVTSWRCQVAVTDANNLPVVGASVRVSTDRPVAVWQEGESDGASTTLQPGTPVTFTGDATGQLVLALPTNELDAAQLTVQALDSSGNATGSPLAVAPDFDVQAFLAGTGSLSNIGSKLTGPAMVGAQNTSWDTASQTYKSQGPLFTGITNLSGSQQSDAANACAAAVAHVANLPTAVPAATGDVRSACLDLTGSAPTFATSNDPNHFNGSAGGDTSWWDKAKNDVDSCFHGLRHGAIHLSKLVSTWADDAKTWTLNLVVTLEDDVRHAVDFVVKTAKDAIHAISSFFHALGADIEKAWNWLKHFVLGVIKDADVTAKQLQAWFSDLVTAGVNILDNLEQRTDAFFQDQETAVTDQITTWKSDIEGTLIGTVCPAPAKKTNSSGDNSNLLIDGVKEVDDIVKVLKDTPAYWLYKKIQSHYQKPDSNNLNIDLSTFQDTVTDLETDLTDAITVVEDLGTLMLAAFKSFSTPAAFNQADMGDLLDDLGQFAHDVLVLLDKLVDTVLDLIKDLLNALEDLLNSELQIPVLGEILKLAGVDSTTSIARIMTLIAAYPITIVHNLWVGEGPLFDFDNDTTRQRTGVGRGAADKNGFGLDLAAGCVQFIWSGVDVAIDGISALTKEEQANYKKTMNLLNLADWVLPICMTILQWPTPWNATTTPKPCSNWDFSDPTAWGKYNYFVNNIVLTTIAPWVFQGVCYLWQTLKPDSEDAETMSDYPVPVVQSICAAMNNVLGAWWQYANLNASKTEKANAILDWTIPNLSYLDCPLGIPVVVTASNGASIGVKMVIDTIANYGATAFCIQQAIAAHG